LESVRGIVDQANAGRDALILSLQQFDHIRRVLIQSGGTASVDQLSQLFVQLHSTGDHGKYDVHLFGSSLLSDLID
jgi:hypothetical protein